ASRMAGVSGRRTGHQGRPRCDRREPSAYAGSGMESTLNHKMLWWVAAADRKMLRLSRVDACVDNSPSSVGKCGVPRGRVGPASWTSPGSVWKVQFVAE